VIPQLKTVILVHGAFADGSSWSKVIPLLRNSGLEVAAVQSPLTSLADDVAAVKRALRALPGPVLLVGHSWGGAVITEAGNDDKVAGLVYVAAAAPDSGESFNDWWSSYPQSEGVAEIRPYGYDGFLSLTPLGMRQFVAQDVSGMEAVLLEAVQGPLAARCFDDTITVAAWRHKPCWYIVAENDRMIPPAVERDSAAKMKATTVAIASSHVAMISTPRAVADLILQAVASLNETRSQEGRGIIPDTSE
jgi:pimeloyl-ACP methyl ester carboxylesterase